MTKPILQVRIGSLEYRADEIGVSILQNPGAGPSERQWLWVDLQDGPQWADWMNRRQLWVIALGTVAGAFTAFVL